MNALSRLITKVTIRQFQMAKTVEEVSSVLDRTIAFANENVISDEQVDSIVPYIPVTEPATEVAEPTDGEVA